MNQGLVLVDIQNDYFDGGAMALENMDQAAVRARRILDHFRGQQLPVVHIQHMSIQPGASFFIPDTQGVEIHSLMAPQAGETVVRKHYPNGFRDTSLYDHLKGLDLTSVVICGAMSHMCIDATTRAAFDLGFNCTVIEDACTTRALEFNGRAIEAVQVHGAFMAALSMPYAKVVSAGEFMSTS